MSSSVLIYGGSGALGQVLVDTFNAVGWKTISVDIRENPSASFNVIVSVDFGTKAQATKIEAQLESLLKENEAPLKAILCVAGGWQGGNAADSFGLAALDNMYLQSVTTSAIAGYLATKFLSKGGFLLLTGSTAALQGTTGMYAYGSMKAAVHHMTKSFGAPGSGMPEASVVAAILPVVLDTPANRSGMPDADYSTWTPLSTLAKQILAWVEEPSLVSTGSLISVVTDNRLTTFTTVQ